MSSISNVSWRPASVLGNLNAAKVSGCDAYTYLTHRHFQDGSAGVLDAQVQSRYTILKFVFHTIIMNLQIALQKWCNISRKLRPLCSRPFKTIAVVHANLTSDATLPVCIFSKCHRQIMTMWTWYNSICASHMIEKYIVSMYVSIIQKMCYNVFYWKEL